MRWRYKHQPPPPSPPPPSTSILSSVLPTSWITKIKKMAGKRKQPSMPNPTSSSPHIPPSSATRFQVVAAVGDAPRRLSVGEDDTLLARTRTRHARSLPRSARHSSLGGDLEWQPFSSCRRPTDLTTTTTTTSSESDLCRRRRPRRRRSRHQLTADGGFSEKSPAALRQLPRTVSGGARKSLKCRHRSHRPKVKVCSPRASAVPRAEVCGVRRRAEMGGGGGGLEGFAVVKRSCDPQRDFRESMVEMIWERGMGRPEELEGLLACYLSLNSDEHHDVIVKVFRQLWFDLNPGHLI